MDMTLQTSPVNRYGSAGRSKQLLSSDRLQVGEEGNTLIVDFLAQDEWHGERPSLTHRRQSHSGRLMFICQNSFSHACSTMRLSFGQSTVSYSSYFVPGLRSSQRSAAGLCQEEPPGYSRPPSATNCLKSVLR